MKNETEAFKDINFQINEAALNEYEKKGTFSQEYYFDKKKMQFILLDFEATFAYILHNGKPNLPKQILKFS